MAFTFLTVLDKQYCTFVLVSFQYANNGLKPLFTIRDDGWLFIFRLFNASEGVASPLQQQVRLCILFFL